MGVYLCILFTWWLKLALWFCLGLFCDCFSWLVVFDCDSLWVASVLLLGVSTVVVLKSNEGLSLIALYIYISLLVLACLCQLIYVNSFMSTH